MHIHRHNILQTFLLFLLACLASATEMMKAVLYEVGGPENLRIGEVPRPNIRESDVLIRVHYTALNRADTLQRKGRYPPPPGESEIIGLEVSGVIEEVGTACTLGWRKGDHVVALLPGGGYAEYARVHESHVMLAPKGVKLSDAAGIPEAFLTSFQLLHLIGKIKPGDRVLIHAGGSGVGTAAVQLAKLAGGIPYVTAGSEAKIQAAKGLGAVDGFNYKTGEFADWLLEKTSGHGVDIIADPVGGSFWQQNAKAIAMDGRWVLYARLGGGTVNGDLLDSVLKKRIMISGTTLRSRSVEYKAELIKEFSKLALPHFSSGELKPIIDSVFAMNEMGKAHARMEANLNTGKIIVKIINDEAQKSEL